MDKNNKSGAVMRRFLMGGAVAVLMAGASGAVNADVVPHQAIYKLKLADIHGTSNFNGVSGASVSVLERTCDVWTIDEQMVMQMTTNVGGVINRDMTFKATETVDGTSYRFFSRSDTDGVIEEFKGSARVRDNSGEAEFITPKPFEMPLPRDTRFYVGTTEWLLQLVKSGAKTGHTVTFDGSDDEGPHKVSVFILPDKGARPELSGDKALLSGKAWEVRLAFFKMKEQAGEPDFEIALRLLENGIITRFNLIFDDMTIDQLLEDVLPAKDESCG